MAMNWEDPGPLGPLLWADRESRGINRELLEVAACSLVRFYEAFQRGEMFDTLIQLTPNQVMGNDRHLW